MRILHTVESYLPARHGMQEVVSQISERLAHRGHEVTVATSAHPERREAVINGVRVEGFAVSGNMVRGYGGEPAEQERYRRLLREGPFDVVTNFAAQQWATDLALPILGDIATRKVLVPTGFSGLFLDRYRAYFEKMPGWMRQYDMNVFLSDVYRDVRFAEEHGVGNRVLIPNGAAEEEFCAEYPFSLRERWGIPSDAFLVLLVGSHTGMKGHKEAVRIFDDAEISNAVLLIVGNHPCGAVTPFSLRLWARSVARSLFRNMQDECPRFCYKAEAMFNGKKEWQRAEKRIVIKDLSRAETVRAYQEADIFLFPSRVECSPIVLFEAMAARTPFLSTDVGNVAEISKWTGGGWILPTKHDSHGYAHADIAGSARMLEELWRDAEKRRGMADMGHSAWRTRFTWDSIARQYERMYFDLLAV